MSSSAADTLEAAAAAAAAAGGGGVPQPKGLGAGLGGRKKGPGSTASSAATTPRTVPGGGGGGGGGGGTPLRTPGKALPGGDGKGLKANSYALDLSGPKGEDGGGGSSSEWDTASEEDLKLPPGLSSLLKKWDRMVNQWFDPGVLTACGAVLGVTAAGLLLTGAAAIWQRRSRG